MLSNRFAALTLATAGVLGAVGWTMLRDQWQRMPAPAVSPSDAPRQSAVRAESQGSLQPAEVEQAAPAPIQPAPEALVTAILAPLLPQGDPSDELPAFDVVRVEPNGEAVIAGRAPPGATVELLCGDQVHDRMVVDQSGQFVLIPPRLPPGDYHLILRSRLPNGSFATSKQSAPISLVGSEVARPAIAVAGSGKPPPPSKSPPSRDGLQIEIKAVRLEMGKLFVSGRSAPNALVKLYLNETYLGSAHVSNDGSVAFVIAGGVMPGQYRLRMDRVDPSSGTLVSRAEMPFSASVPTASLVSDPQNAVSRITLPVQEAAQHPGASAVEQPPEQASSPPQPHSEHSAAPPPSGSNAIVEIPAIETTRVTRGDNLWRISRHAYGRGIRYTTIYDANRDKISDPNRIYPGQVFVMPNGQPTR